MSTVSWASGPDQGSRAPHPQRRWRGGGTKLRCQCNPMPHNETFFLARGGFRPLPPFLGASSTARASHTAPPREPGSAHAPGGSSGRWRGGGTPAVGERQNGKGFTGVASWQAAVGWWWPMGGRPPPAGAELNWENLMLLFFSPCCPVVFFLLSKTSKCFERFPSSDIFFSKNNNKRTTPLHRAASIASDQIIADIPLSRIG